MSKEPFIFGIPLIARASTDDWRLTMALLDLTMRSVRAQTDPDFQILVAGHDRPDVPGPFDFIAADWPATPVRADNLDSGRKKTLLATQVLAQGGGLLMFLDADDWVETRLVATAREGIAPHHVGGLVSQGFAIDPWSLRSIILPHPTIFTEGFHRLCGSSTIARLDPAAADPMRRNPHASFHEHYRWPEAPRGEGCEIAILAALGTYVVNTSTNHSERHGPFAAWRRAFCLDLAREGTVADEAHLARFGLSAAVVRRALPVPQAAG